MENTSIIFETYMSEIAYYCLSVATLAQNEDSVFF